jgi:hypothetical protein
MKNNGKIMGSVRHRQSRARLFLAAGVIIAMSVSGAALAQTALKGSDLILPATADMIILKTENSGRSGSFSVVVTNTGSVEVTGAAVTDIAGLGGICPKTSAVTITGNGVPEGSFTIANLSGSGIALGTLQPGQSATLTYSCQGK